MAHSPRTLRVATASFIALLLVAGAYVLSGPVSFFGTNIAGAQSSEELLREYAAKDTDSDNLPDWQEALYGTNPNDAESFKQGMLDGDAVAQGLIQPKVTVAPTPAPTDPSTIPGTTPATNSLTDRFAQTLISQYLSNRGEAAPTQAEILSFVKAGVANLESESISPARYTVSDVRTQGQGGKEGVLAYAAAVESAFATHTTATEQSELGYFSDALKGEAGALSSIKRISNAYAAIAEALIALPVPSEARQANLSIANALARMSEVSADMATMDSDPVRALMGIGLYERSANELTAAFTNLHGVFEANQITETQGVAGYYTIQMAREASERK